jgi:hypothetical protein
VHLIASYINVIKLALNLVIFIAIVNFPAWFYYMVSPTPVNPQLQDQQFWILPNLFSNKKLYYQQVLSKFMEILWKISYLNQIYIAMWGVLQRLFNIIKNLLICLIKSIKLRKLQITLLTISLQDLIWSISCRVQAKELVLWT